MSKALAGLSTIGEEVMYGLSGSEFDRGVVGIMRDFRRSLESSLERNMMVDGKQYGQQ